MCRNSNKIKLEIFQFIQRNLAEMGFTPNQQKNNHGRWSFGQTAGFIKYSIVMILFGAYVLFEASSVEEYILLIFDLTSLFAIIICFISIIFKNDKLFEIIEQCGKTLTIRSQQHPSSRKMHEKTGRLLEKLSEIIYFGAMLIIPGLILPKGIYSYFTYFTTDSGGEAFDLPILIWYPFDWKNPIVYFVVILWTALAIFIMLRFPLVLGLFGLGCFLFALSLTRDMKNDIRKLSKMAKNKKSETDLFQGIVEFLRTHSNVKKIVVNFVEVFEITILIDVMCCTFGICSLMVVIQMGIASKDAFDPARLRNSIFFGCAAVGVIFGSCELGQRITDSFDEIAYEFVQLDWYLFPSKIQRILPTILIVVQKPLVIGCFGTFEGSRDQFKKVVNVVYKSFNLLRKIFK